LPLLILLKIWKIKESVPVLPDLIFVKLLLTVRLVNLVSDRERNASMLVQLGDTPLEQRGQHGRTLKVKDE
jgi:hypothetical protein